MKGNSKYCSDYYRMTGEHYRRGLKSYLYRLLFHNLNFAFCLRRNEEHPSLLSKLRLYRLSRKYGLEISPSAKIDEGLYLGHPYNITVGEGVTIGKNVNLHKGCTIGKTNRGNIGSPTIGDCVYIGVNSTTVGDIHIGNDVLIAPNSYVNINVPDHSIVIGNPATIHHRKNATEDYVVFTI